MAEYPEGFRQGDKLPDKVLKSLLVNDVPRLWVRKVQALAEVHFTDMDEEQFTALENRFREKLAAPLPVSISEDDLRIRQRHEHK